jgi:hypothetical protein
LSSEVGGLNTFGVAGNFVVVSKTEYLSTIDLKALERCQLLCSLVELSATCDWIVAEFPLLSGEL